MVDLLTRISMHLTSKNNSFNFRKCVYLFIQFFDPLPRLGFQIWAHIWNGLVMAELTKILITKWGFFIRMKMFFWTPVIPNILHLPVCLNINLIRICKQSKMPVRPSPWEGLSKGRAKAGVACQFASNFESYSHITEHY